MFRAAYEAMLEAIIRFWNNRFLQDDQIRYLRMEVDKLRQQNTELVNHIILMTKPAATNEPVVDTSNMKPLRGQYRSWEQTRRDLESRSAQRARELSDEAAMAVARSQTTEELESELGIETGTE